MKGLEIAKRYYEEFGKQAIHDNFPELENVIAIGLAGSGSECYGFDDEVSIDHDFEPGFCIWIPDEGKIDSKTEFKLSRVYAKLPKEYMGLHRNAMSPVGGNRHGVIRISEFLENHIGRKDADLTLENWFNIPEYALSEIVNGEVWNDDSKVFTTIRNNIKSMPEDVRLKKLAGSLYIMGQSGVYNYSRCLAHKELGAAQLALTEFVKHTMHVIFLLNKEYMPYYKWAFKALRNLPVLSCLADKLEYLINTGNSNEEIEKKKEIIEECSLAIIEVLKENNLTTQCCNDLGHHADSVNNKIKDNYIRNTDLLSGVGVL